MPYNSALLDAILNSMNEGVLVLSQSTFEMIECNSTLLKTLGISESKDKIGKQDIMKRIKERIVDTERFERYLSAIQSSPLKQAAEELHLKNDQYVEWRTAPFEMDGEVTAQIFFFKDVTEQKNARKNLLNQHTLLESIISSIPYSIFWKDENLNYLGCNQSFAQDAGKASPAEIIGKCDYDMPWSKAESDSFRQYDRAIMKSGVGKSNIEETQQQADGRVSVLLTSKVPLKNDANQVIGILGIYTDITEFKNAQKTIKDQESLLVSASQLSSLGEMAGGIAHEINNPLSIIKASTKYLSKVMDRPLTETSLVQMKETIQEMDQTVERIAKIVVGLRNISRSSEGEKDFCCFQDILSDVLSVAKERFKASGIKIKENYSDDALEISFRTQRIQISQVIINLLNNSFDALKEIESDNKWIEIGLNYNAKYISFYVADSGEGIPDKIRSKMFHPFFTTKDIGKGTGIGLSISKSLIEKNGGTLVYDSNSPHTKFAVQLPRF